MRAHLERIKRLVCAEAAALLACALGSVLSVGPWRAPAASAQDSPTVLFSVAGLPQNEPAEWAMDSKHSVRRIDWNLWGAPRSTGQGTGVLQPCFEPGLSCAAQRTYTRRVGLIASGRLVCRSTTGREVRFYSRMRVHVLGPLPRNGALKRFYRLRFRCDPQQLALAGF
jgi:hypothetical protein